MIRIKKTSKPPLKKHNSAVTAKVALRRWLVEQAGRPASNPRLLLCRRHYLGLDIRQFNDARRTIVTDSRRYLRHVDAKLEQFDLFDLDAFGSPMEHLALICHRVKYPQGKRIGFMLTDGTGFNAKMNGTPHGLLAYVGVSGHKRSRVQTDYRDDIAAMVVNKALGVAKMKKIDAKRAEVGEGGAGMRYSAILVEAL